MGMGEGSNRGRYLSFGSFQGFRWRFGWRFRCHGVNLGSSPSLPGTSKKVLTPLENSYGRNGRWELKNRFVRLSGHMTCPLFCFSCGIWMTDWSGYFTIKLPTINKSLFRCFSYHPKTKHPNSVYSGDLNSGKIWITNINLFPIQMPSNSLLFKTWLEYQTKSLLYKPWSEKRTKSLLFKPSVTQPISQTPYDLNSELLVCYSSHSTSHSTSKLFWTIWIPN